MLLKVCGIRHKEQAEKLSALNVDFIGFIFYKPSPRYVGACWETLKDLELTETTQKVGVFVNASFEEIKNITFNEKTGKQHLDIIQLHGTESPDFCMKIKNIGLKTIKVFSGNALPDQTSLEAYEEPVDYFLFDHRGKKMGGSGKAFDWATLLHLVIQKPFFISGGLHPESTTDIAIFEKKVHNTNNTAHFFALDINSGFEISPGVKDLAAVEFFLEKLKNRNY